MGKLHEILAVESSLKSTKDKVLNETKSTFEKKRSLFQGMIRKYTQLEEGTLDYPEEIKLVEYTVKEQMDYIQEHFARALDCFYQKDIANTKAKSDLIVDGQVLAKDIPATYLLTLEQNLIELRNVVYVFIPTLEPGRKWEKDTIRDNIYTADGGIQNKSEKVIQALVLYPATDKHPAQTEKVSLDKPVGRWNTIYESGCISSSEKSKLLARLDTLIRAVK